MSYFFPRVILFKLPFQRAVVSVPPSPPSLKLSAFYQLASSVFDQKSSLDPLGVKHCITVLNKDSLSLKFLGNSSERSLIDKVRQAVTGVLSVFRKSTHIEKEQNILAWKLFKKTVIEHTGNDRFYWVCKRYNIPVSSLESGAPLLAKHIKLFYIGLSHMTVGWMERQWPEVSPLNQWNRINLTRCIRIFHKYITGSDFEGMSTTSLARFSSRRVRAFFNVESVYHDERKATGLLWNRLKQFPPLPSEKAEKAPQLSGILRTRYASWLEEFCKDMVSRELVQGQLIPVWGIDGKEDWYQVYAKVSARGLFAYALKPVAYDSSLKPLIVFRPTQRYIGAEDAIGTFINGVELKIGNSGWLAAREAFQKLMADPHFREEGEKIAVAGYSIGGAHLQYFLYEFAAKVSEAFSFNAPSVDQETAKSFAKKVNEGSELNIADPLSLYIIRTPLDHVPKFGDRHVGHGVKPEHGVDVELVEVFFNDPKMGWEQQHSARAFGLNTRCKLYCYTEEEKLKIKLDNFQRGVDVGWYQNLHHEWGWLAFRFFQFLDQLVNLLRTLLGTLEQSTALRYTWN